MGGDRRSPRRRYRRHVGEAAHRVVGGLRVERRRGDDRRGVGEQQRVAVRRRLGHDVGAEDAARAGTVVHQETLPQALGIVLGEHARGDVARPAGREDDDDAHRARRPSCPRPVCAGGESWTGRKARPGAAQDLASSHGAVLPSGWACAQPAHGGARPHAVAAPRLHSSRRMRRGPVARDVDPPRHPHARPRQCVVEKARQRGQARRPPDQAAVQPDREHLRRPRLAFRVEAVEGVAQVGEELLAGREAAGGREAHVVGVERVRHDEVRAVAATPRPSRGGRRRSCRSRRGSRHARPRGGACSGCRGPCTSRAAPRR